MNHPFKALLIVSFLAISSPLVLAAGTASLGVPPQAIAGEVNKGGQVVESQGYHLEFLPKKTEKGMLLDFFLQKSDNHSSVVGANVKTEVTMPDGKKQTLSLKYDTKKKHYTTLLETKATGDFKVAILCDIGGKKVNGRFSFKR